MKRLKRIMALVIAMAMVLSMGAMTALAEGEQSKYIITVENSNGNVTIKDSTFTAYKLFDVNYFAANDNESDVNTANTYGTEGYNYTILDSSPFFANTTALTAANATQTSDVGKTAKQILDEYFDITVTTSKVGTATVYNVIPKKSNDVSTFTAEKAYELAQRLNPFLSDSGFASTKAGEATGGADEKAVIDVGADGYFLVTGGGTATDFESPATAGQAVTAAVALTTTHPQAAISAKLDAPGLEKKIDAGTTTGDIDGGDVDENTAAIGDTVPFVIKSAVPDMKGYDKYFYIVTDTLSKGLTFNNNIVVKIDGTELTAGGADTYDVYYSTDGGTTWGEANILPTTYPTYNNQDPANDVELTFKIVFKNFIKRQGTINDAGTAYTNSQVGKDIIITYSATVNDNAAIGNSGNENTAKLTYTTNPNIIPDGTNEPSNNDPASITGETPEKETKTFVSGLEVFKYKNGTNNAKDPLAGATFKLESDALNDVREIRENVYIEDAAGTYFLLTDGTYTTTDPTSTTVQNASNKTELLAQYVDPTGETKFKRDTITYTKSGSAGSYSYEVTTDANGKLTFTGLKAGNYTLTETAAPSGYNKLDAPIYFTLAYADDTWTATVKTDNTFETTKQEGGNDVTFSMNTAQLFLDEILNETGTLLPSTGGIGTTIFYVVGAILVIGAGVILITRRRMDA
jgi:fimbrial isopeptide formation D2 family protein/LPXTG-motif cell wall-anchored protein